MNEEVERRDEMWYLYLLVGRSVGRSVTHTETHTKARLKVNYEVKNSGS